MHKIQYEYFLDSIESKATAKTGYADSGHFEYYEESTVSVRVVSGSWSDNFTDVDQHVSGNFKHNIMFKCNS